MKDNTLCNIVARLIEHEKGGNCETNVIYSHGEMDVLHINKGIRTYYEIKSTLNYKFKTKGIKQVKRAIRYGVCDMGYVLTPDSMFEVKN